ncbi:RDD family protein [Syntrophomonas curvata]
MADYDENIPTREHEKGNRTDEKSDSTGNGDNPGIAAAPAVSESCTDHSLTLYPVAGFWIRLLAFSIDLLIVTGLNSLLWNFLLPTEAGISLFHKIINVNSLFLGITGSVYFILMTRYFQQTLGKMIVGIKVIQRSGEPLSWVTVIFRELVARSLSQLMGLNLGYIVCWFNPGKRCVHDYLSDTWVVYENPDSRPRCISVPS